MRRRRAAFRESSWRRQPYVVAAAEWDATPARAGSSGVPETVSRVRIPLAPPRSLRCREIRPDYSGNCRKWARFRNSCPQSGPEKVSCSLLPASFAAFFSGGQTSSPVSKTPSGECDAITNRWSGEGDLPLAHCTVGNEVAKGSVHSGVPVVCQFRTHSPGSVPVSFHNWRKRWTALTVKAWCTAI
jgi:hypothetical protein